jgi:hypothetical protein
MMTALRSTHHETNYYYSNQKLTSMIRDSLIFEICIILSSAPRFVVAVVVVMSLSYRLSDCSFEEP